MTDNIVAEHKEEINFLVRNNDIPRAVKRLLDFARNFSPPDVRFERENEAIELIWKSTKSIEIEKLSEAAKPAQPATPEEIDFPAGILKLTDKIANEAVKSGTAAASKSAAGTAPVFIGRGIEMKYRSGRKDNFKLSMDISLELRPGEITGLVGENGSGKTTLLRIIAGELAADAGEISYPLFDPGGLDWRRIKNRIGYVPQQTRLRAGTILTNLYIHAAMHGLRGDDNIVEIPFMLLRMGLEKHKCMQWTELTGGYKMRFEIVRALLPGPDLLILDEPLAPLDIVAMHTFLRDLRDIASSPARPLPVIVSSQHLHEIESIADKILFIEDGKSRFYGTVEELKSGGETNSFEIACGLTPAELQEKLRIPGILNIRDSGSGAIINASSDVTAGALLAELLKSNTVIEYFRDISKSTRKMFGKQGESS